MEQNSYCLTVLAGLKVNSWRKLKVSPQIKNSGFMSPKGLSGIQILEKCYLKLKQSKLKEHRCCVQ